MSGVVMQFECGTRILRVIHGRDARATPSNCTTTMSGEHFNLGSEKLLSLQMSAKTGRNPSKIVSACGRIAPGSTFTRLFDTRSSRPHDDAIKLLLGVLKLV